jgi:putative membrane protein
LATTLALLLTSPGLLAQSGGSGGSGSGAGAGAGGAGSGSYGAGQSTAPSSSSSTTGTNASGTSRNNQPTSATGSGYQSGTAAADVDSTRDINSQIGANQPTGRDTSKLGWGDRRFVTKAADSGMTELQLAQLAAERASNPEVRSFAQKLVQDHSKVNSELTALAGQKNVRLDLDDSKDRSYKRLSQKSGAEFDQEFVEHMIDEHEKDVKMFEKAASDAKDQELRSFASKHVGHLREHLQQAQSLRQTVMPTGRMDDSSGRSTSGGTTGSGLGTSSTGSSTTSGTGSTGLGTGTADTSGSTSGTSGTSGTSTGTSGTSGTSGSDTSGSTRR